MTTALGKIQSRGQVTLPREIRHAADIRPGDTVMFVSTGPQTVEMRVLPRLTLAEMIERFGVDEPLDWESVRKEAEEAAAQEFIDKLDE